MNYWKKVEQGPDGVTPVYITLSEDDILKEYFQWWSSEMHRIGKDSEVSPQNCIEDWVIVNWAELVERPEDHEQSSQAVTC